MSIPQGRSALAAVLAACALLCLRVPAPGANGQIALVAPPEPVVTPRIPRPSDRDSDSNGIDDRLESRLRGIRAAIGAEKEHGKMLALQTSLHEPTRVEVVFSKQITRRQIDDFVALGGQIEYIYQAVSYGWNATVPLQLVEVLAKRMGDSFVAVVGDKPAQLHLDEATRTGRVRPVWSSGYTGTSTTTIGILDTGIDDSHTDLLGRMEYWKDYTSDNEPNPRDIIQHGTHVTGIALGSGASAGSATGTLYFTDSGDMSSLSNGYFYPTPIHILTGSSVTLSSTATWVGGGTTTLYGLYRADGSTGSYSALSSAASGGSPLTESNTFTPSSSSHYTAGLIQNAPRNVGRYAIANSVTNYPGVDSYNKLSGVAPSCKWAGGKVFTNSGTGSGLDIQEAIDDMVTQRVAHNIKVVNMSLGIIGNPGLDTTLRTKVNNMVSNGIVAVVSAGNDGPGTAGANLVDDPGRAKFAITVAASNDVNQLTRYTSSGFSSPGADEDSKPDLMAPGGSDYYSLVLSVDSNDADAESTSFADARADDYYNIKGTSMAAPFVAGSAALVIQALESAGLTWNYSSSAHPLLVKMLLCATCTESNANREVSSGTNPTLGRAAAPKDLYEGYGLINPDAAVEAAAQLFTCGTINGSTAGGYHDKRAWARKLTLNVGTKVTLSLVVPSSGDFDLYLYSGAPEAKGNPVIRASSANMGNDTDESINYTASTPETAYLVIKRVSGSGSWSMTGYVDGDAPVPGTATSPAYANSTPIVVSYSGASDVGCGGIKKIELWYKNGSGGTWTNSGLTSTGGSGSFNFTTVSGDGTYYFDLVAEDNAGNRSVAASGSGDCGTVYSTTGFPLCGIVYDGGGGPLLGGNTYRLTCDVTVPSGQQLTAAPGVSIIFDGWKTTALDSVLGFLAGGSQADPIWFLSSDSANRFRLPGQFKLTNGGAIRLQ